MATERTTTSQTANLSGGKLAWAISFLTFKGNGDAAALGYMLITVVTSSLLPLVVYLAGGSGSPFLFNSGLRAGVCVGCLMFLVTFYRGVFFNRDALDLIRRRVFTWPNNKLLIGAIIHAFDFALFAWSVKFIDIAVSAILFETWPVFMIFFAARLFKDEGRYQKITFTTMLLIFLSTSGFFFALVSQAIDISSFDKPLLWNSVIGMLLVVSGTIAAGFTVFGWKWGTNLSAELSGRSDDKSLDLGCAVIALFITSLVSVVFTSGIGVVVAESISFKALAIAITGGVFAHAVTSITLRKANFTTANLGINVLNYFIPILSLIWLFWLADTNVARWDYLIIGAAAIITANLLINFDAEVRLGFKALLLALGTCGAVVYLRDGVFELLGVVKWNWTGSGYFESLTLAATVFTLLLAFRVARLVSRTSEEDNRTFIVYRKLDLLARRGIIDPQVCYYILQIDKANNDVSTEREAYTKARRLIAAVDPAPLNEADSQLLSDAEANLDALARSKQVDIHLGEQFALGIFGAITIGLALLTMPSQVEGGWTRLMVDLFAMLISAVIIFLLFHIQDLQRERDDQKLEPSETGWEYRHYLVRFLDIQRRSFDKRLSIAVGAAIVLTYAALLSHKWLGWLEWLG